MFIENDEEDPSARPTFTGHRGKRCTKSEPQESAILETKGGANFKNVEIAMSSLRKN